MATPSQPFQADHSSELTAAAIGLGVGIPIIVIALLICCFCYLKGFRSPESRRRMQDPFKRGARERAQQNQPALSLQTNTNQDIALEELSNGVSRHLESEHKTRVRAERNIVNCRTGFGLVNGNNPGTRDWVLSGGGSWLAEVPARARRAPDLCTQKYITIP